MSDAETVADSHVGEVTVERIGRGIADRVHDAVQAVPCFAAGKHSVDFIVIADIAREASRAAPSSGLFYASLKCSF